MTYFLSFKSYRIIISQHDRNSELMLRCKNAVFTEHTTNIKYLRIPTDAGYGPYFIYQGKQFPNKET